MAPTSKPAADAADDLDDLDDILDEFNAGPAQTAAQTSAGAKDTETAGSGAVSSSNAGLHAQAQAGSSSSHAAAAAAAPASAAKETGTGVPGAGDEGDDEPDDELNEQFARELAQGMEALMRGMNPEAAAAAAGAGATTANGTKGNDGAAGGAGTGGNQDGEAPFDEEKMMKQFEQMMADMGLGAMGGTGGSSNKGAAAGPSVPSSSQGASRSAWPQQPANFNDAIRNTMSRLRESDASATNNASSANEMDFEKLLAAMGNAEGGEGGEEGIANMLENMMNELMSKEVLYEPLKELRDKYPGYLASPPANLSAEDRARYEKQYDVVRKVIAKFDDPKFDNGTETEKKALKGQVQDLMNEMQDNGAPPPEIVGDLPPEFENLPGMGGNDENCTIT